MAGFQFMKHLWLGFQDYATITFRPLGLNIVVCWFRSFLSKSFKRKSRIERPKVAIREHRPAAFLRALVHVLPVAAALFLIIINLYDYYVGASIQSLVFYQFIAKVFEIMAQASLAAIVFSYIRHEMILGQGIPLGALFSGLQLLWAFTNLDVNTGGHGVPLQQLDAVHHIEDNYYQPYTIGSCANDTIEGATDDWPLAFPMPPGVLPQYIPQQELNNSLLEYPAFPFANVTRAEILDTAGPSWENRLRWVELPQDPFNGSASGALVLLPSQDPEVQKIVVCTLGAGWGQSTLNISTRAVKSISVKSSVRNAKSITGQILLLPETPRVTKLDVQDLDSIPLLGLFISPIYPQRLIEVTRNFTKYLNPFIAELNTTVFHHLMQNNLTLRDHTPAPLSDMHTQYTPLKPR